MIAELGHFGLALAVAFAIAQGILPLWGAHRGQARLMQTAPALALGQMIALGVSFLCLVFASVADDFSVLNIAENSHSLKPLLYKITGAWGSHEGSILFWCLILAICGGLVALFGGPLPASLRARAASSSGFISLSGRSALKAS